jgi:hypothetical protein
MDKETTDLTFMMSENVLNLAATALTSWKAFDGKHGFYSIGHDLDERESKRSRVDNAMVIASPSPMLTTMPSHETQPLSGNALTTEVYNAFMPGKDDANAHPFFYYKDRSREADPDPFTPLTLPGRVPK